MAFTPFETSTTNISVLSDRPNQNDGLSSAQLKGRFDKAGNDIKTYINDVLLEELESVTDGGSGADNIGATAVGDGTATTVQGILEELDADVTALDGTAVHLTGNEAIAGIKNFTDSIYIGSFTIQDNVNTGEIIGGTGEDKLSFSMGDLKFNGDLVWTAGNDGHASGLDADTLDGKQDADMVHKAGEETVTGVKTFSASPIVPAPTTDTQASTKKYVDDADVLKVNITDIVNDLTTGGTAVPLSAEQGKVLKENSDTHIADTLKHKQAASIVQSGILANAEGDSTTAKGKASHAEGYATTAHKNYSHAEGGSTNAHGVASHAEGYITEAHGLASHAEGYITTASGDYAHSQNLGTLAQGSAQTAVGTYNVGQGSAVQNPTDNAFIVGNGTSDLNRSNAMSLTWSGDLTLAGGVTAVGNVNIATGKKYKINDTDLSASDVGALSTTDAGDLAELTTTEKGSLVGAINELDTDKVETSAIVNTLTETEEGKVLDARQGRTLSNFIGNQTYTEKNYIADGESATASINKLDMQLKDTADLVSTNSSKISTINFNIGAYLDDFIPLGASWDKGEVPTLTRTDYAVGKVANIGIDSQVVQNDFDSASIYREIIEIEDTLGNKFVRIPKFYIRKVDINGFKSWQICKYKHPGFYLPWCFWDFANSRELPYIDIGKYNASLSGTKLASVANTYPLINKNIVDFRGYAQANNAEGLLGYQQLDVHVIDVLRTLFFIEFGTLNSQAIMRGFTEGQYTATHLATATEAGANRIVVANAHADLYRVGQAISVGTTQGGNQKFYGRTITGITVVDGSNKAIEFDGDPVDIVTGNLLYNTGWKSGFSSNIVASSGCIVANDGKYPCSYRGIENPFGSVWQFVDGVNITDNQAWVCKDAGQYASNVFASPYEKLSYVNLNASGYGPVEMGYDTDLPFAEFATSVTGGSTSKHYCDRYYQDSGSRIALFGGSWSGGLDAGLSCWSLSRDSSRAYFAFGGRLLKKPL